ncbi:MAG: shikimate dehydrogenase [Candidatus Caenarcaniphilales bacterium]|nr:shikimate dehydrogenase [Candidatus Caenarcaniphilales bacterium]
MINTEVQNKLIYNLALLGFPVEHSLSPDIHNEFLRKKQLKGGYLCIETTPEKFTSNIDSLQQLNFKGVNLTIPHKQLGIEVADDYSEETRLIGASNTLVFREDKTIFAENTDWIGFLQSLPKFIKSSVKKVAIIGAGGSARAIITALLKLNVIEINLFIRSSKSSHKNAFEIRSMIEQQNKGISILVENIDNSTHSGLDFDLVVNTTPIGMSGMEVTKSPFPDKFFELIKNPNCYFYDLIYNPAETRFLKLARSNGFDAQNGYKMLYLQAAYSFSLWTGIDVSELY